MTQAKLLWSVTTPGALRREMWGEKKKYILSFYGRFYAELCLVRLQSSFSVHRLPSTQVVK